MKRICAALAAVLGFQGLCEAQPFTVDSAAYHLRFTTDVGDGPVMSEESYAVPETPVFSQVVNGPWGGVNASSRALVDQRLWLTNLPPWEAYYNQPALHLEASIHWSVGAFGTGLVTSTGLVEATIGFTLDRPISIPLLALDQTASAPQMTIGDISGNYQLTDDQGQLVMSWMTSGNIGTWLRTDLVETLSPGAYTLSASWTATVSIDNTFTHARPGDGGFRFSIVVPAPGGAALALVGLAAIARQRRSRRR